MKSLEGNRQSNAKQALTIMFYLSIVIYVAGQVAIQIGAAMAGG